MMPSLRLIVWEVHAKAMTIRLMITRIIMSMIFSNRNATGLMDAAMPSTNKMLKMLEPMTYQVPCLLHSCALQQWK